jgi:hypothetical protein
MAVCDAVRESKIEPGVFDLKRVRQEIVADVFPFAPSRLWLFVVLSCPRPGAYPGAVMVESDSTERTIFYAKLLPVPTFDEGSDFLSLRVRLRCSFPAAGGYSVRIAFYQEQGIDVVKEKCPSTWRKVGDPWPSVFERLRLAA